MSEQSVFGVMRSLVCSKFLGIDAPIGIGVDISEFGHFHPLAMSCGMAHAYPVSAMRCSHRRPVRLLRRGQLSLGQLAIAIGIDIFKIGCRFGAFHRFAGFSHGRHALGAKRSKLFFSHKSIAVLVEITEGGWLVRCVRLLSLIHI